MVQIVYPEHMGKGCSLNLQ